MLKRLARRDIDAVSERLCARFNRYLSNPLELEHPTACHVLLCASELNLRSHAVSYLLDALMRTTVSPLFEGSDVVSVFLRQITLCQYGVAVEHRRDFLERWLRRVRGRPTPIITKAWLIGLASEQQDLIPHEYVEYVSQWFQKRMNFESLRMASWVPRYLELWGHYRQAKERAAALLARRRASGGWGHGPSIDAAVAYALSKARCVGNEELIVSADRLAQDLSRGVDSVDPSYALSALKLFLRTGHLSPKMLERMRMNAESDRSVFLSHASADKAHARKLATELRRHEIKVWVDEAEIKPGDSIIGKIEAGICSSRYLFFLASEASLSSKWVQEELRMAIHDGICRDLVRVVPIRLDATPLPGFLREKRYVTLIEGYDNAVRDLMRLFDLRKSNASSSDAG